MGVCIYNYVGVFEVVVIYVVGCVCVDVDVTNISDGVVICCCFLLVSLLLYVLLCLFIVCDVVAVTGIGVRVLIIVLRYRCVCLRCYLCVFDVVATVISVDVDAVGIAVANVVSIGCIRLTLSHDFMCVVGVSVGIGGLRWLVCCRCCMLC